MKLELHVQLAAEQNAPCVARLANHRLDERREYPLSRFGICMRPSAASALSFCDYWVPTLPSRLSVLVSGEPWMYSGMTRKEKARVIQGEETAVVKEYSGPTGKNVSAFQGSKHQQNVVNLVCPGQTDNVWLRWPGQIWSCNGHNAISASLKA